jgi:hypothetical protein
MYIDGTLQSNTNAYDIYPNTAVASYIGCYRGGTYPSGTSCNGNFDGKVDDIHIYKRALNEAEISKLYCDGGWCIEGCTDINATNYNANANIDDGSCTYDTPTEGLVAYYPFTGNAEDASGNGNDGDINEGTDSGPTLTTDRFGNDNSAYSFDGSNDFIEVQHSNALNIFEADFTITLFFNTNQNETDHTKLLFDKRMNDGSSAIAIGNSNGNLSFHLEDETHYYQIYSEPISDGEWHFAVLLRTVNQMQMSIDGDWINESVNISDLENINNIGDMKIGARFDETEFYQGYMDELRIYNHALTEAEIEDLYCGGGWCVGNCTDPLADNYSEGAEIDDGSCSGSPVNAVDFTYSGEFDGHYYYLSNYTANWNDAKTISENSSGHLVTISTEEENMFVSNLENAVLWIGLTDEVEENNWVWVTDEPFQYTNWKTNEPNDGSGNEDYVMTNYNFTIEGLGFWNDYNGDDQNKFVLEIEKGCTDINATNYNANANIDDGTCEFITNGLVTYYPFEKTSMNSLLLDGLKGVEGVIGGSIEFDGSNNMRVFNEVSPNGTDFSFFTWINFHELETEYIIGDRKENSNVGWFIYTYSDGNLQFGYKGDILVNCYVTTTIGNVISINNWYHLGFVINTQNNEMIAYVNGIIVGNFIDNHCNSVGINHDDLLIGHSHEGGYLMGKIDEFVVYNNALGNNNVIELYNNGAGKRVDETTFGMTNVIYYNDMDVLTDMSGNGNNGTANGNPTQTATGYNETSNKSAMEFDGIDDKVCIDLYNAEQNTGTISVWFKSEDSSSEIMGQDANGWNNLDTNFGIGIQNASCGTENKLTFSTHGPVTSDVRCVSSTTSVNDNNWHHGVAVVTGSQYQIWVDGVNEANISTDYGIWGANGSTELCFPEDANYNGKLDEVRIYNHALSASEIQALYQQ